MAQTKPRMNQLQNPYGFRVWRSAAANSGNAGFAKVTFDTEIFDDNNNFSGGTFTATVPGTLQVNWSIQYAVNSVNCVASLYKNGVEVARGNRNKGNAAVVGSNGSDAIKIVATDTLEVYAYADSTTALDVPGSYNNFFSGLLISS